VGLRRRAYSATDAANGSIERDDGRLPDGGNRTSKRRIDERR
jgi:hypothetical protein